MFDNFQRLSRTATSDAAAPLRYYAEQHRDGLLQATAFLGDERDLSRLANVLEVLASSQTVPRRTLEHAALLLELLSLGGAHQSDAGCSPQLATIDPFDPALEEICLLAEGLRDALSRVEAAKF